MKKSHLAVIIAILILTAGITAGSAQADVYMDRIQVTLDGWYDQKPDPADFNPWGLAIGDQFDIVLTYDPATAFATSGYIEFSDPTVPTNTFSAAIFGDTAGHVFDETEDYDYGDGSPNAFYTPTGTYDPDTTVWDFIAYYGYTGAPSSLYVELGIDTDSDSYLGIYEGSSFMEFNLDVNLAGFNPATDRVSVQTPIPGSLLLLGSGLLSLMTFRRRNLK